MALILALGTSAAEAAPVSRFQRIKSGRDKRVERKAVAASAKSNRADCATYEEELQEAKLSLPLVKQFREDYLRESYTSLLDQFAHLWNFVHNKWIQADEAEKKVIRDFRRDWRQKLWYHQKDDPYTRERGLAELRDEYRERFKKFAQKHFVTEPWGLRGWGFQVRKGIGDVVFPVGSVIELEDGELTVARYAKVRLAEEMGGFIMNLVIRNDVYASKIKVVSQRGNFRFKTPATAEILESARRWSTPDDADPEFDKNEDRLELLLDERFERCGHEAKLGAGTEPEKTAAKPEKFNQKLVTPSAP